MNPVMSARSWAVTAVGSLLLTGASTAAVTPWVSAEGANPTVASSEAVATLQRASQAARSQPYSGTQFLSAWTRGATTSVVVNVIHVPGRGSLVQVPATAGGVGASILESDTGPSAADGPAGLDGTPAVLPGLDAEPLALLQRNYDVSMAPAGSCAGRPGWRQPPVGEPRQRRPAGSGWTSGPGSCCGARSSTRKAGPYGRVPSAPSTPTPYRPCPASCHRPQPKPAANRCPPVG